MSPEPWVLPFNGEPMEPMMATISPNAGSSRLRRYLRRVQEHFRRVDRLATDGASS
jgi:hypothetical protein